MKIYKQWFGRGGYPIARFYSCTEQNMVRYFLDYKNCKETVEIKISREGGVSFAIPISEIPKRYASWVYMHWYVVFQ